MSIWIDIETRNVYLSKSNLLLLLLVEKQCNKQGLNPLLQKELQNKLVLDEGVLKLDSL